jgi:16S rRNA (guanine966-N2)-methyltransferase
LAVPKDNRIRPTCDRVREAIFNILAHGGFAPPIEGARVLDLFAGTGALGLEALSRGAVFATFVDDHAQSRALIRHNIEALREAGRTRLLQRDATDLGPLPAGNQAGGPFDHLFLDPPYGRDLIVPAISNACAWLKPDAVIIAEFERDISAAEIPGLELVDQRGYGDTRVAFWRRLSSSGVTVSSASA